MEEESDKLEEFQPDFAMFVEAGFVAANQCDEVSARQIFAAAQLLRPEHTAPQVGLGFIALNKLEVKEAVKIFTDVIAKEPDNHLACTMLGICHLLVPEKRAEGKAVIKKIQEQTDDPSILNLAKTALEWSEKDLKRKVIKVT